MRVIIIVTRHGTKLYYGVKDKTDRGKYCEQIKSFPLDHTLYYNDILHSVYISSLTRGNVMICSFYYIYICHYIVWVNNMSRAIASGQSVVYTDGLPVSCQSYSGGARAWRFNTNYSVTGRPASAAAAAMGHCGKFHTSRRTSFRGDRPTTMKINNRVRRKRGGEKERYTHTHTYEKKGKIAANETGRRTKALISPS